mmetsp:Transcript_69404/g.160804  ORF Transcript_69404/g.160804 Transcript_69404/m.160804 type:complete len:80 (+) Transcript_69404:906-1145(+)
MLTQSTSLDQWLHPVSSEHLSADVELQDQACRGPTSVHRSALKRERAVPEGEVATAPLSMTAIIGMFFQKAGCLVTALP